MRQVHGDILLLLLQDRVCCALCLIDIAKKYTTLTPNYLCSYDARTDVTFCLSCFEEEEKARRAAPMPMQGWRSQTSTAYAAAGPTHAMMTM